MKTQFSRFWEPRNHAEYSKSQCRIEHDKKQCRKHVKQSFGVVILCSRPCSGRLAWEVPKRHPSSLIWQIPIPFLCSGSHWGCTRSIFAISFVDFVCIPAPFLEVFTKNISTLHRNSVFTMPAVLEFTVDIPIIPCTSSTSLQRTKLPNLKFPSLRSQVGLGGARRRKQFPEDLLLLLPSS